MPPGQTPLAPSINVPSQIDFLAHSMPRKLNSFASANPVVRAGSFQQQPMKFKQAADAMRCQSSDQIMYEHSGSETRSTEASSDNDSGSVDFDPHFNPFTAQSSDACSSATVPLLRKNSSKPEGGWKRKVKTELCKFWLNGQACENQSKEQGCGFAHGQDELQKKKGLSKQYMTSVCKNFLDHPSKCSYGQRCIFQHPTHNVRSRQNYVHMMQDNARYTAMRLFQEIEGAEVIYINTYAATAPRLQAFRSICSNAKDNGEDYRDTDEDYFGAGESSAEQASDSGEDSPASDDDTLSHMLFMPNQQAAKI